MRMEKVTKERGGNMPQDKTPKTLRLSIDEIITRYEAGENSKEIAKGSGVEARWIRTLLRRNGVKMRKSSDYGRQYDLNEHFFDKWSQKMAYVLGLSMFAMTINAHRSSMAIRINDRLLLERVRDAMEATNPINHRIHGKSEIYDFRVHSYKMHETLIQDYGFQHRRTSDMPFPNVPLEYAGHFLRGLFDGKGRITIEPRTGFSLSFFSLPRQWARGIAQLLTIQEIEYEYTTGERLNAITIREPESLVTFVDYIYKDARVMYRKKRWQKMRPHVKKLKKQGDQKTHTG